MPSTSSKLYILTGPVHTGKSSALTHFVALQQKAGMRVCGLLNPSIGGEKFFVNIESGEKFSAEKIDDGETAIQVGKYSFSAAAFSMARQILALPTASCDLFVLDEIGKLELKGKGLEPAISEMFAQLSSHAVNNVLVVVRDYLLDDVTQAYDLNNAEVLTIEDLKSFEINASKGGA